MLHPYLIEYLATERQRELRTRAVAAQPEARSRATEASEPALRPPRVRLAVIAGAAMTGRWARRSSLATQASKA